MAHEVVLIVEESETGAHGIIKAELIESVLPLVETRGTIMVKYNGLPKVIGSVVTMCSGDKLRIKQSPTWVYDHLQ